MVEKKWVVLGTGGTIAGLGQDALAHTGYTAGRLGVERLLSALPAAADWSGRLELEQLAQVDSKDMSAAVWAVLARAVARLLDRQDVQGIVITHGTDTLEETAFFLHTLLAPLKPVVLTCAMRPATALGADGPQNLLDALTVAAEPQARGVLVVCAGRVLGPLDAQKVHPYRLDALSAGDAGVIAYVEEGQVRQLRAWPEGRARRHLLERLDRPWPRVPVILGHALAQEWVVEALVSQGAQGLVLACPGNGSVHQDLLAALQSAQARGVRVVRTSRCPLGRMVGLSQEPLPFWSELSAVKARIALSLDLMEAQL